MNPKVKLPAIQSYEIYADIQMYVDILMSMSIH